MEKINAYHGTTVSNAMTIIQKQEFSTSKRNSDWLGTGVYFFANDVDAKWWVSHSRFQGVETAVLDCQLAYNESEHLDLDNSKISDMVEQFVEEARDYAQRGKLDFDTMSHEKKWCFMCNFIQGLFPEYKIRSYTFEDKKRSNQSRVFGKVRKQFCVVDHSIIRNIQLL